MKDKENRPAEFAEQMMKQYEQTVQTGLKIQEEAVKCWKSALNSAAFEEWQKRVSGFTDATEGVLPKAQKRAEEVLGWMGKTSQNGACLVAKAIEAAQAPTIPESQSKWLDFWSASLNVVQSSSEELGHIQSRAMDAWVGAVRQNGGSARGAKAAA